MADKGGRGAAESVFETSRINVTNSGEGPPKTQRSGRICLVDSAFGFGSNFEMRSLPHSVWAGWHLAVLAGISSIERLAKKKGASRVGEATFEM